MSAQHRHALIRTPPDFEDDFMFSNVAFFPRFLLLLILCVFSLTPFYVLASPQAGMQLITGKPAESAQLAQDIASAGGLRMQAQRLSKLNQQVVSGIQVAQAMQQIRQVGSQLDGELVRLARYSKKPGVQRSYQRCESLWQEMREVLTKNKGSAAANERINQLADELMLHAGKLSMQIEAESDTPVGRLLDLSSRLNMLSQRLARLYLQALAEGRSSGVLVDIEQARKEFSSGLSELDSSKDSSQASREAIGLAKNQWIFFEIAIVQLQQSSRQDSKATLNVVTSSERIAQLLDLASTQYIKDYSDAARNSRP